MRLPTFPQGNINIALSQKQEFPYHQVSSADTSRSMIAGKGAEMDAPSNPIIVITD